jgi:hypothetical protein
MVSDEALSLKIFPVTANLMGNFVFAGTKTIWSSAALPASPILTTGVVSIRDLDHQEKRHTWGGQTIVEKEVSVKSPISLILA